MNDVVPMLTYADGPAAMDWLASAFGFEEQTRWLDDDGRVAHGEMRAGDGLVMIASTNPTYEGPTAHRRTARPRMPGWPRRTSWTARWSTSTTSTPTTPAPWLQAPPPCRRSRTGRARLYRTEDIEGHRWMFMQRA